MNSRSLVALLPLLGMLALSRAGAQEPPAATTPAPTPTDATATAAAPAATATTSPSIIGEEADDGGLNREMLSVEQDVDRLKERVFRSKATLQLLKELVLEGSSLGSGVVLYHVNKMGGSYELESVMFYLDGKNVYAKMDAESNATSEKEVEILEQSLPPGPHNLQVSMVLRGNGFGVFSYLKSYSFKVQSSYSFNVEDGKQTVLKVVSDEKGGPWRTFVDRPNVEYEEETQRLKSPD